MSMANFTHPHDMVNPAQQTKRFGLRFAHPFALWRKSMMLNAKLKKMKERLDHPACQAARRLEAKANELLEAIADVNAFKDGAEDYLMNEHYFEDIETMRRVVELVLSCTTPPRSGDEMLRDFKIKV